MSILDPTDNIFRKLFDLGGTHGKGSYVVVFIAIVIFLFFVCILAGAVYLALTYVPSACELSPGAHCGYTPGGLIDNSGLRTLGVTLVVLAFPLLAIPIPSAIATVVLTAVEKRLRRRQTKDELYGANVLFAPLIISTLSFLILTVYFYIYDKNAWFTLDHALNAALIVFGFFSVVSFLLLCLVYHAKMKYVKE